MRSILLLSFALLPVAATAQARSVSSIVPETTMTAAISGMPAATPAFLAPVKIGGMHEVIRTVVDDSSFVNPMLSNSAELDTTFGEPENFTEPKLASYKALTVSDQDLVASPKGISVSVNMIVDTTGEPYNVHIVRSAGKKIDELALATVKDYRFEPATVDYRRVKAPVTIEVEINKQ